MRCSETKGNKKLLAQLVNECTTTKDGCLEHTNLGGMGYPQMRLNGAKLLVRRIMWECANDKEIPEGMIVSSTCGNRRCCNPEHLVIIHRRELMNRSKKD